MHVPRMLVISGGLLLSIVAVLILFFLLPTIPAAPNDLGMTLVDWTVVLLIILAFFFGLFFVVEGSRNSKTTIKRTLESTMMRFRHKTH